MRLLWLRVQLAIARVRTRLASRRLRAVYHSWPLMVVPRDRTVTARFPDRPERPIQWPAPSTLTLWDEPAATLPVQLYFAQLRLRHYRHVVTHHGVAYYEVA